MAPTNPYQSPSSQETGTVVPAQNRPVSPMVIGIISIVFAAFGFLSTVVSILMLAFANPVMYTPMGFSSGYMLFSMILGVVFTFWLLAAGIGLIRYRHWGRMSFNWYAIITILWSVSQSAYLLVHMLRVEFADPAMQAGAIGGAVGGLFALILPFVGLIFLNLRSVRESLH